MHYFVSSPPLQAWIASDVMCSTASIINLCAISLDRYVHIKDPLQYTELITRKSVPVAIAIIWVVSALISFLPISLNLHCECAEIVVFLSGGAVLTGLTRAAASPSNSSDGNATSTTCLLDFNPSYSIASSFVSFFFPCFIMLFIYFHVYNFARYHMECIKEQSKPLLR